MSQAYKKGRERERYHSLRLPTDQIPILASSKLLRRWNCGQIDLASLDVKRKVAYLYEVKSFGAISQAQQTRLRSSADLLGHILNTQVLCRVLR